MDVEKHGMVIPVSDSLRAFDAQMERIHNASPEQLAEWARQAADKRKAERDKHAPVHNVAAGIARHFRWTEEYVIHLAQPYCDCDWDNDGCWNLCTHAYDLGLDRTYRAD